MQAYVLVQGDPSSGSFAGILRNVPGVLTAEDLAGPYSAIVLIRSLSHGPRLEEVLARIRQLPAVTRVLPVPFASCTDERGVEAA